VRRRVLVPLIAGWLLGLLTAFAWPAVSTERRTVMVRYISLSGAATENSTGLVAKLGNDGWVVTSTDQMYETPIVQLERPRYMAVAEQLQLWWWELTQPWRGAAPQPTPAPPKPAEAPTPTAPPAASPRMP
jgi:hypothetical protein